MIGRVRIEGAYSLGGLVIGLSGILSDRRPRLLPKTGGKSVHWDLPTDTGCECLKNTFIHLE